jgi:hypothetical protein
MIHDRCLQEAERATETAGGQPTAPPARAEHVAATQVAAEEGSWWELLPEDGMSQAEWEENQAWLAAQWGEDEGRPEVGDSWEQ